MDNLRGRKDIFTATEALTEDNIITEINNAIAIHLANSAEEDYLYWYRRGEQPVMYRTKQYNEFILNKVVENLAEENVTFKNGYFLQEPACYISRTDKAQRKIDKLNEYLYRSGKHTADNKLADWFHTVGKAALFVERTADKDAPVRCYAVDPRSAFVVYSLRAGNKPVYAVNMVVGEDVVYVDVFTDELEYRLTGRQPKNSPTAFPDYKTMVWEIVSVSPNLLRHIPIIEYRYNSVNMASFEPALSLYDAINEVQSSRVDGVDQFIQSVAVAVNCEFPEDTTASDIRKAGMIVMRSTDGNKAEFKILSEELNQSQTQTLVDNLYEMALRICSMPSTTKGGSSTSDTGSAVYLRDGWGQASGAARNTEDLFKESNRQFDRIMVDVLREEKLLDVDVADFELNFVRNETAGVQSKAQAFQTLLAAGLHPELAAAKSGISNDPVADIKMSEPYLERVWNKNNAESKPEVKVEEKPTEEASGDAT